MGFKNFHLLMLLLAMMRFDSNDSKSFLFANACSCTPGAISFDEAFASSSSIFEAEIIDRMQESRIVSSTITNGDNYYNTLHVSKVWKGIPQASHNFTVQTDPGSLCGYDFGSTGSKYLVYTSGSQTKKSFEKVYVCGRTRPINHDEAISDISAMINREIKNNQRILQKCGTSGKGGKGKGGKGGKRKMKEEEKTTDCDDEPLTTSSPSVSTTSINPTPVPTVECKEECAEDNSRFKCAKPSCSACSFCAPTVAPTDQPTISPTTFSPSLSMIPSNSPSKDSPVLLLDSADIRSNDCQELVDKGLLDPSLCTGNAGDQYLQSSNQQPRHDGLFFQTDTEDDSHDFNGSVRRRHLRRSSKTFR